MFRSDIISRWNIDIPWISPDGDLDEGHAASSLKLDRNLLYWNTRVP